MSTSRPPSYVASSVTLPTAPTAPVTAANARAVLSRWVFSSALDLICDLERSQGAYIYDASRKRSYLDFFAFFGSRALGFNHPGLQDADFVQRLQRASVHKVSNCDICTVDYARFANTFCQVALGGQFRHVFFIEGGGPAVENAIKAAFDWKRRKNMAAAKSTSNKSAANKSVSGNSPPGGQILHFSRAFHGRTGYALSLTDPFDRRKVDYFPTFAWPRVTAPAITFPLNAQAEAALQAREAQAVADIERAFAQHANDIAAIIIEPIQGEGGDNHFSSAFLQQLRRLCDEHEALLIFDEVQTGFGASGAWWAWQHHDVKPDLMTFGKKTHVCGFAASERIDQVDSVFQVPSRISSTFEGSLTDMMRCERFIEIIQQDKLLYNAQVMGERLLQVLQALAALHPQMSAVRGRGLLAAFDMPSTEARDRLLAACFQQALLVMPCGERSVRFRPSLDISAADVDEAATRLDAALKSLKK